MARCDHAALVSERIGTTAPIETNETTEGSPWTTIRNPADVVAMMTTKRRAVAIVLVGHPGDALPCVTSSGI
jgi:hypothetical protein